MDLRGMTQIISAVHWVKIEMCNTTIEQCVVKHPLKRLTDFRCELLSFLFLLCIIAIIIISCP